VGFIFQGYVVGYWYLKFLFIGRKITAFHSVCFQIRYWECIEMFRKFLMTSVLVNLIAVGQPEQVAAGYFLART
jgi:hypothetical protein